jgi:hypothetical protein
MDMAYQNYFPTSVFISGANNGVKKSKFEPPQETAHWDIQFWRPRRTYNQGTEEEPMPSSKSMVQYF